MCERLGCRSNWNAFYVHMQYLEPRGAGMRFATAITWYVCHYKKYAVTLD